MGGPATVQKIPKPPALTQRWVRLLLGCGVSVGIGLAPLLGKLNIPLFTPLLKLIPETIQPVAIALSTAAMSVLSISIQFYGEDRLSKNWLRKAFARTLIFTTISFLALFIFYIFLVVRVDIPAMNDYATFVVGFSRSVKPPCDAGVSDAKCIELIGLDPVAITSFWGDRSIHVAQLCLILPYLAFMSCFGILSGLVVLRQKALHQNSS